MEKAYEASARIGAGRLGFRQRWAVLAAAGTNKSRVLSASIWVTDIRNREAMNEAWLAWIDPANPPARATVEAKLASPEYTVEIMVTAAR